METPSGENRAGAIGIRAGRRGPIDVGKHLTDNSETNIFFVEVMRTNDMESVGKDE